MLVYTVLQLHAMCDDEGIPIHWRVYKQFPGQAFLPWLRGYFVRNEPRKDVSSTLFGLVEFSSPYLNQIILNRESGGPCTVWEDIKGLSEQLESLPLWPFGLDQV
jgi:hypothetical protein